MLSKKAYDYSLYFLRQIARFEVTQVGSSWDTGETNRSQRKPRMC